MDIPPVSRHAASKGSGILSKNTLIEDKKGVEFMNSVLYPS